MMLLLCLNSAIAWVHLCKNFQLGIVVVYLLGFLPRLSIGETHTGQCIQPMIGVKLL